MITDKQRRCIRFIECELYDEGVKFDGGDDGCKAFEFISANIEKANQHQIKRWEEESKMRKDESVLVGGMVKGHVTFGNDNGDIGWLKRQSDGTYTNPGFRLWR